MKLLKRLAICAFLMCAVLLSGCQKIVDDAQVSPSPTIEVPSPSPELSPEPSPSPDVSVPTVRTERYVLQSESADIVIEYPVISGLADANLDASVNELLYDTIVNRYFEEGDDVTNVNIDASWTLRYIDAERLSVSFAAYTYYGGAHPNGVYGAINIDLRAGAVFSLGSVAGAESLRSAFDTGLVEYYDGVGSGIYDEGPSWADSWFEQYYGNSDIHLYDFWCDDAYLYVIISVPHVVGDHIVLRTALSNVMPNGN
ncbi:MAG: DUF4163 domain-containing protein [Oscillospiraceae bacterium]|jgi:hypothetical protein|nr:DUF4163 domain-containing protein [Oscillospiraceae bacterium]